MRLLVGDIGGTKTVLAVAEVTGARVTLTEVRRYASQDFRSLEAMGRDFQAGLGQAPQRAAFAVAGPVLDGRSRTTNLPWELDSVELRQALGLEEAVLLNDLEAVAWGIPALGDAELAEVQRGDPAAQGNASVVAAGTGLGQAGLFWDGQRHHPFATEGGHGDFAPGDDREIALLCHLRQRFARVSWERLVSGPGIASIHEFLVHSAGAEPPDWLLRELEAGDPAASIAAAAAQGRCALCVAAMDLFWRLYGREAGNTALKHMALGGVYLAGGIAPKNLEALRTGPFLEAFLAKGRVAALMQRIPVKVILAGEAPLYGAALFAAAARDR